MKQINMTECKVTEAMSQIDALDGLNQKDKGCLRLLTEEMFSMVKELLKMDSLDFEIKNKNGIYTLRVTTKTRVDEKAREHFLSISSNGENTVTKGIKGMLGSILEIFFYEAEPALYINAYSYGIYGSAGEYAGMWSLSNYIATAPKEKVNAEWDGMEKSIIANFADDVAIGVRSGKLEMTVTKQFN